MEIVAAFKVTPEAMPCTLPVVTWADHRGKVQKLSSAGVLAQRNPVKWAIIKTRMIGKFGETDILTEEKFREFWKCLFCEGVIFTMRILSLAGLVQQE